MKRSIVDIVRDKWNNHFDKEHEKKQKVESSGAIEFVAFEKNADQDAEDGEVVMFENDKDTVKRPPWMPSRRDKYVSLEQEIQDFSLWVQPTRKERQLREESIHRLQVLVQETFERDPDVTCHNFGSFFLNLFLPGSDLDFVVMGAAESSYNPLRRLATSIRNKRYASAMQLIENTRVPIVKYTDIKTSVECDISFDISSGITMGHTFTRILRHPSMSLVRPLVMAVKYWLRSRDLHEPFNGGMGSYSVLILVISLIQLHVKKDEPQTLSGLFRLFFEFYGTKFNWITTGISILRGGSYFSKDERGGAFCEREPWRPALEDPIDTTNNIAAATFNLPKIRDAMYSTHKLLQGFDYASASEASTGVLATIFLEPHIPRIN